MWARAVPHSFVLPRCKKYPSELALRCWATQRANSEFCCSLIMDLKPRGVLSEGLELIHLQNLQPGLWQPCRESRSGCYYPGCPHSATFLVPGDRGTDGIPVPQACQVTGWGVSTSCVRWGFKCQGHTGLLRQGMCCGLPVLLWAAANSSRRGVTSQPPVAVCSMNSTKGKFCDWLCLVLLVLVGEATQLCVTRHQESFTWV